MDPLSNASMTGGADLTIWLIMFGVLILVALVLAFMSRGMDK
jgi:hypothetical protein